LLRPGRFDMVVELEYPDENARRAIFAVHTRGRPLAPEITMEELASLTPGRSGADIEAICRRAALLALREWIAPKLGMARVQITEAKEEANSTTQQESQPAAEEATQQVPPARFQIRPEHFAQAIDEQRERYAVQDEAEDAVARREEGRQRLLEMAANYNSDRKPPRRGFRYWLARLLGFAP